MLFLFFLALGFAVPSALAVAHQAGSFNIVGDTLVSALIMFVGINKVYIIDKAQGNAAQINNHSAYAAVWNIDTQTATPVDVQTNSFCAAGMHLPNGSFAVFGGNHAVGPGGWNSDPGSTISFDPHYQDYDGERAIRIITPCDGDITSSPCYWYDDPHGLQMVKSRWYPGAEALANGSVLLFGGFTAGGYINRRYPNVDPEFEGGLAEPTVEMFPSDESTPPQIMNFMVKTSGLNAYSLTYLMPSGKMFVQANYSTILWDYDNNIETPLPDMPEQIIRVYPASGANAMLPLTPANGYTPTIIFCGGQSMQSIPDAGWGDYSWPVLDTWTIPASSKCHRITPEPTDGSTPAYVEDDDLIVGRTLGQFIALPDGKFLLINGAGNGTGGYSAQTGTTTTLEQMPFGQSLASGPVTQPAIYDPIAPRGSRWSTIGLNSSTIPRMYHSSALLLPDGSVMVAGSNPNPDVNLTTIYPTTYTAELFYPPYFSAGTRPVPQNIPKTLSYGGNSFDITIPASSFTGLANTAANSTKVWLIRQGFTTHAMNMGQRIMQLNNTFTVQNDGTIILHTAQLPPSPNLFQPGPAFLYVTISGIPSNGSYVIVGNGVISTQSTAPASVLPPNVFASNEPRGGASLGTSNNSIMTAHVAPGLVPGLLLAVAAALFFS